MSLEPVSPPGKETRAPRSLRRSRQATPGVWVRPPRRRWFEPGVAGFAVGLLLGALVWFGFEPAPQGPGGTAAAAPAAAPRAPAAAKAPGPPAARRQPLPAVSAAPPRRPAPSPPAVAARPPSPDPAAGSEGMAWVQLAATPTEADAEAEWDRLVIRHESLLSTLDPRILRVERGEGAFFRLRVGPFASRSDAGELCRSLRARAGSCFVTLSRP